MSISREFHQLCTGLSPGVSPTGANVKVVVETTGEDTAMGIVTSLSIVGTVLTFIVGALGGFPLIDLGSGAPDEDPSYGTEAVHQAADGFSGAYTSIIDELVSFQKDPDYERAETRRQELVAFSTSLGRDFQDLEARLRGELEGLTVEAE